MSQKKIKGLTRRLLEKVRARLRAGMDKKKWLKKCEDKARALRKKKAKEEKDENAYQPKIVKRKKKK